jgi:hypothetical protein
MFVSPGLQCSVTPTLRFLKRNSGTFNIFPQTDLEMSARRLLTPDSVACASKTHTEKTGTEYDLAETRSVLPSAKAVPYFKLYTLSLIG